MNIKIISLNAIEFDYCDRSTWPKNNQKIIYIGKNIKDIYKSIYYYQKNNLDIRAEYFYTDGTNNYSYSERTEYETLATGLYTLNVSFTNSYKVFSDGDYWIDYSETLNL